MLWFWSPGPSPGPPTPPSTPKADVHLAPRPTDAGAVPPSSRQNIDFSHVDISDLSSDVIGTIDGFDVREFDQYLSPNSHGPTAPPPTNAGLGGPNASGSSFTSPSLHPHPRSSPTSAHPEDGGGRKPQVKTEQMSPDHRASPPSPLQPEVAPASSILPPPVHPDRPGSTFYSPVPGYAAPLYQHPYFHPPRVPYAAPFINGLALAPPPHSPPSGWEQPIYTTLTRP